MYGLEAISAQNGWTMAITGALIVMSGLTVLSLAISQLYKVVALFEKKEKKAEPEVKKGFDETTGEVSVSSTFPLTDIRSTAARYRPLTSELDENFELGDLYKLFQKNNLPHPHLTIRSFRESGLLIPIGEGRFTWHI